MTSVRKLTAIDRPAASCSGEPVVEQFGYRGVRLDDRSIDATLAGAKSALSSRGTHFSADQVPR
jgi:hypothetical protein